MGRDVSQERFKLLWKQKKKKLPWIWMKEVREGSMQEVAFKLNPEGRWDSIERRWQRTLW